MTNPETPRADLPLTLDMKAALRRLYGQGGKPTHLSTLRGLIARGLALEDHRGPRLTGKGRELARQMFGAEVVR